MPHFAMIVVVEAENEEAANRTLDLDETYAPQDILADRWMFVGDPWKVEPRHRVSAEDDVPEWDTVGCIEQRDNLP